MPGVLLAADLAWVKYPLAAIVVTVFLAMLGLIPMLWARRSLPEWGTLLTPLLGMAWLSVGLSWYAHLHWPLRTWALWLLAIACLTVVATRIYRRHSKAEIRALLSDRRELARAAWDSSGPWLAGIAVIALCMVPIFEAQPGSSGFLTTFTLANNDVGTYVAEATNLARSGFGNAGVFFAYNPGTGDRFAASYDHTATQVYLAAVSSVLGGSAWKTAQVALLVEFAGVFAAATMLARALLGRRPTASLVVAGVAAGNVLVLYLAGHFFAAQLLCLAMSIAQLALVIGARDRLTEPRIVVTLATLGAACALSSPEQQVITLALLAVVLVASCVYRPGTNLRRALTQSLLGLAAATALSLLLVIPFINDLRTRVQVVSQHGVYGWVLDLHDAPLTMLGYPERLGEPATGLGTATIIILAVLLAVSLALAIRRGNTQGVAAGIVLAILGAAMTIGSLHYGFSGYQSWKLIMTLSVPALVAGFVLLASVYDTRMVLTVAVAVAALNLAAGARQWSDAVDAQGIRPHSVTNDLATFLRSTEVQRQDAINVDLPQRFSTMIAPAVFDKVAALSSVSSWSLSKPGPRPYACTLVDANSYNPDLGPVVYAKHGYLLVATPRCN